MLNGVEVFAASRFERELDASVAEGDVVEGALIDVDDVGVVVGDDAGELGDAAGLVAQLEAKLFAAALSGDANFFSNVLADDWYYADIVGTVRNREQYIEMLDLVPPNATMRMVDFAVRERADVTLVRGTYLAEAVLLDGRDVSSETQFTAAWERGPDGWRCLLHHATRTAPTPESG